MRHFKLFVTRQIQCLPHKLPNRPNEKLKGTWHKTLEMLMKNLPSCVFNEPNYVNTDKLVYTLFFPRDSESFFHYKFRPYLATMLSRSDNDV